MEDEIKPAKKGKICASCGVYKEAGFFYKRGKYLYSYCKECVNRPVKHERLQCPHCKELIGFVGLDYRGDVIPGKPRSLIKKIEKQVKVAMRKKHKPKVKNEKVKAPKSLSDIIGEED